LSHVEAEPQAIRTRKDWVVWSRARPAKEDCKIRGFEQEGKAIFCGKVKRKKKEHEALGEEDEIESEALLQHSDNKGLSIIQGGFVVLRTGPGTRCPDLRSKPLTQKSAYGLTPSLKHSPCGTRGVASPFSAGAAHEEHVSTHDKFIYPSWASEEAIGEVVLIPTTEPSFQQTEAAEYVA